MNALSVYLLEASVCLGVFYLFYLAVLQRQSSFQYNRVYLLVTLALGWILPLLNVPIGSANSYPTTGRAAYLLLSPTEVEGTAETTTHLLYWTAIVYGLGVLITLIIYSRQFFHLYQITQVSQPQPVPYGRYRLLYTNGQFPTASFFRFLLWDNTQPLTVEETWQMMSHEEAHIRQGHSYDVLYLTLLKVLAWFHPLVYLYDRALIQTHEYAADASVLRQPSANPKAYARLLSKRTLTQRNMLPVNYFFYPSQILTRIHMIYANSTSTPWYRYVMIVPVLTSLFFTFSCQPDEEELARRATIQSYDETAQAIDALEQQIQGIQRKYYPTQKNFTEALDSYRSEHAGSSPSEAAVLEPVASSSDLNKVKQLVEQRNQLREQLAQLPDSDGVYTVVANRPEPANGMEAFYQFIGQNMKYPAQARRMGIEGKVFVQFVVNQYGELTKIKTLKGIGAGCDEEAMRVVREAPDWQPGTNDRGNPVGVRMVLPITFEIGNNGRLGTPTSTNTKLSAEAKRTQTEEVVVVGYQ